jgi:hypothetical protein
VSPRPSGGSCCCCRHRDRCLVGVASLLLPCQSGGAVATAAVAAAAGKPDSNNNRFAFTWGNMRHGSFQQVVEANSRYEYDVPNSAAAVCCCWILVLQIPERSPKMAVCKRFASFGPLNSALHGNCHDRVTSWDPVLDALRC